MLPIKSNLDWTLISPNGQIFFADSKTFAGEKFTYSQLSESQLKRVQTYAKFGACAGFMVHLRGANKVVWYDAAAIASKGPRSGFGPQDGAVLGALTTFDLRGLLS